MATVLSVETVRASCLRITWQWTDGGGIVHGPNVTHTPLGTNVQAFVDALEQDDIASLVAAEIAANLEEIAG